MALKSACGWVAVALITFLVFIAPERVQAASAFGNRLRLVPSLRLRRFASALPAALVITESISGRETCMGAATELRGVTAGGIAGKQRFPPELILRLPLPGCRGGRAARRIGFGEGICGTFPLLPRRLPLHPILVWQYMAREATGRQ